MSFLHMNKRLKIGFLSALLVVGLSLLFYIPIWQDDAEARRNRTHVHEMISVGQDLYAAEVLLKNAGFKLMYDRPITPTVNENYLEQLVIIGETQSNGFETFAYIVGLAWMPFTHSESPYVVINAGLDGEIIKIK